MDLLPIRFLNLGHIRRIAWIATILVFAGLTEQAFAQGTLEDYQRAQRFLPGNLRHLVFVADVRPNWIEKTNRFWYRRVGPKGTEFVLVDAQSNTSLAAFDQAKLAAALSQASKHEYDPMQLPFEEIEFVEGKAVRFKIGKDQWSCTLADYQCKETSADDPDEALSPDKKWTAFVQDHNLYVRYVSTDSGRTVNW